MIGPLAQTSAAATDAATVQRVRSLLRTWELFGTGHEGTMVAELRETLDPETPADQAHMAPRKTIDTVEGRR